MIRTVSSTVAYSNPWMRVREDVIERAGRPGLYGVVEKSDAVIIAAVDGGEIHLVEQFRYPVGERYWEMPQGICGADVGDPVAQARAELEEETGLRAGRMTQIGELFQAYGYSSQRVRLFLAGELQPGEKRLDPEEADLISRPFPIPEFRKMVASGRIMDCMTIACLALLDARGAL